MCKKICIFATKMQKIAVVHRIWSYLKHYLSSWNTTGEGIHSPYLFYIVHYLLRDTNSYYCFDAIERRREMLLACEDKIEVVDYGSAGTPEGLQVSRCVKDIARGHLECAEMGQLLFRITTYMGHEQKRPLEILELGTSLGITTSYLASASSANHVVTLEGSESIVTIARKQWKTLKLTNIECVTGNIDDTLSRSAGDKLDLVYVDANHTFEATKRYVDFLLPRMTSKGIIVVDDIHYSPEMERAWRLLQADKRVSTSIDVYHAGLLFVDPHYLKRHYRVRL